MTTELYERVAAIADQSPEIDKLAEALAKAQAEIKGAAKNSKNPHFNRTYADLEANIEAAREPLAANGLSVTQPTRTKGDKTVLVTKLLHESGQWVSGELPLIMAQSTMQALGSALTYARRYGFAAMVGIAPVDDDGEAASGRETKPAEKAPGKPPAPQKPAPSKPQPAPQAQSGAQTSTATPPPATTEPAADTGTTSTDSAPSRPGKEQLMQVVQIATTNGWEAKAANEKLVANLKEAGVDVTSSASVLSTWTWEHFKAAAEYFQQTKQG